MAKDLANIEATKRALDDVRFEIKKQQRIQKQLKLHLIHLQKTK